MKSENDLPEGFAYPIGYFPSAKRVRDKTILLKFKPFERPYVITNDQGDACVDPKAPGAVRSLALLNADGMLLDAIRYLEMGTPDGSLRATYDCEDQITRASNLSEAGFRLAAIDAIRQLPKPFQQSGKALKVLVNSLYALGRYEEALHEVRLITASANCPTTDCIMEAELLLLLGNVAAAEAILDRRRGEFRQTYEYYGVRASAALLKGDEVLARCLIRKAASVEHYNCFKILWMPLLKPLEAYIRRELLTEDEKPRYFEETIQIHSLCNCIQAALLASNRERALTIAEGLLFLHVAKWDVMEEVMLALAGLGNFEAMITGASVMVDRDIDSITLACQAARAITTGNPALIESSSREHAGHRRWDEKHIQILRVAALALSNGKEFQLPETVELFLVEVQEPWDDNGRYCHAVHWVAGRFHVAKMWEPRQRRMLHWADIDLRTVFSVIETTAFASTAEMERWFEEKLNVNYTNPRRGQMYGRILGIYFDGWTLATKLSRPAKSTPLLREAWDVARQYPNFYHHNGPAESFKENSPYPLRLLRMLAACPGDWRIRNGIEAPSPKGD